MKRKYSITLCLLTLLLILPVLALAAPVGKFTNLEGNVDVTSPGKGAVQANLGDQVQTGDIIRTKSKAKCEVTFIDGSILRLAENSRLRVSAFSQSNEKRDATLDLFRGKIQNVVQKVAGAKAAQSRYEVHTPTAVCGVRGTQFFAYHQAGVSGAVVTEGTVYAYSANKPAEVRTINAGQAMVVTSPNTPPSVRPATAAETQQHQKDTTPSEKPKSEDKDKEEKKAETGAAKTDEGQKEEAKKEEDKKEGQKQEEAKAEESKPADSKPEDSKPADNKPADNAPTPKDVGKVPEETPADNSQWQSANQSYEGKGDSSIPAETAGQTRGGTDSVPIYVKLDTTDTGGGQTPGGGGGNTDPIINNPTGDNYNVDNNLVPTTAADTTQIKGEVALGDTGISNAAVTANINNSAGTGTLTFTGVAASGLPSGSWGGTTGGSLGNGNYAGFMTAVSGSWEGLLSGIYINDDGGAGYLTGDLAGTYNESSKSLTGSGAITRSGVLGQTTVAPATLADSMTEWGTVGAEGETGFPLPVLGSIVVGGAVNPSGTAEGQMVGIAVTNRATTGSVGRLGVWGITTSGGVYTNNAGNRNAAGERDWSSVYGRSSSFGTGSADNFFMVGNLTGKDDLGGHVTINGDLAYLENYDGGGYLGQIGLAYQGKAEANSAYSSAGAGTFTLDPLTFGGNITGGGFHYLRENSLISGGSLSGLWGGTGNLMSGASAILALGKYTGNPGGATLFTAATDGSLGGMQTAGFLNGRSENGNLETAWAGLYIRPRTGGGSEIGFLQASGSDSLTSGTEAGFWRATGEIAAFKIGETTATSLSFAFPTADNPQTFAVPLANEQAGGAAITLTSAKLGTGLISDSNWGLWQTMTAGTNAALPNGAISTAWIVDQDADATLYQASAMTRAGNNLSGATSLGIADWYEARTYVGGGSIKGIVDSTAWGATATGVWFETPKFLEMQGGAITDATANATLKALNIPAILVGQASLTQSAPAVAVNNLTNLSLGNVRFFATSTGSAPRLWATGSVTGNYNPSALPTATGPVVHLTSGVGGISADFGVRSWEQDTGLWGANVIGGGTLSGSGNSYSGVINLTGGAAGTFAAGSLTGTAAGTAAGYGTSADTTPPSLSLAQQPDALNFSDAATFTLASPESGANYLYSLDGGSYQPLTNDGTLNLNNLSEGQHTLILAATDAAGNRAITSTTWTAEYTPPVLTLAPIAMPAAATGGSADIQVGLRVDQQAVITASLDGVTQVVSGLTLNLTDLATGAHTLEVQATGRSGRAGSQTLTFNLDNYSLTGSFYGCLGNVSQAATGWVAGISGQDWGGWKLNMTGTGNTTPNPTWTLSAGGQNEDGSYWMDLAPGASTATNAADPTRGTLAGTSTLTYLSATKLGIGTGTVVGTFDAGSYNLTDTAAGSYTETPLAFSAGIEGAFHYYDSQAQKITYNRADEFQGLLGTVASPFASAANNEGLGSPVTLNIVGLALLNGNTDWGADISLPVEDLGANIPDGFMAGRTTDRYATNDGPNKPHEAIEGIYTSLYVDAAGNAGTLEGSFQGLLYPISNINNNGIFKSTSGTLIAKLWSSGFAEASYDVEDNYLDGNFAGFFRGVNQQTLGTITAESTLYDVGYGYLASYTAWLTKNGAPEPWGIFNIELGGYYSGATSDTWALKMGGNSWRDLETEYWLADATGTQWSEQNLAGELSGEAGGRRIVGNLSGYYLRRDGARMLRGDMTGTILGSYAAPVEGVGTWTAVSLGTFAETPLTWGGDLQGDFLYHDYYVGLNSDGYGYFRGLQGGVDDLLTGATPFMMLGEYDNPEGHTLWGLKLTGATEAGVGFNGQVAGVVQDNDLKGMGIGLYIKPDGTTGYLTTDDLAGRLHAGIGMWEASGTMTAHPMGVTGVLPSELGALPSFPYAGDGPYLYSEQRGQVVGDLRSLQEDSVTNFSTTALHDQNWGIWLWSAGGTYDAVPTANWHALVGIVPGQSDNYYPAYAYGILRLDGASWSENNFTGALDIVNSKILTPTTLTTFLTGSLLGTHNAADNTWQAIAGGASAGQDLKFFSDITASLLATAVCKEGSLSYDPVVPTSYTPPTGGSPGEIPPSGVGSYSYEYFSDDRANRGSSNYLHYELDQGGHLAGLREDTYYRFDSTTGTGTKEVRTSQLTWHEPYTTYVPWTNPQTQQIEMIPQEMPGYYAWSDETTATAAWDPEALPLSLLEVDPSGTTVAPSIRYLHYAPGRITAGIGGTESLWTATAASPAPVTVLGRYRLVGSAPHLFKTNYFSSRNDKDDSATTYDGGAYRGFLGGTEVGGVLEGSLVGLYLDPSGNAGYLKGRFTGAAYQNIDMIELTGGLYPTQMAAGLGLAPQDIHASIWETSGYNDADSGFFAGVFAAGGQISVDGYYTGEGDDGGDGMSTLSFYNQERKKAENWGVYGLALGGTYTNPGSSWAAKLGGSKPFGAYYDNVAQSFVDDQGYWGAEIADGTWSGNKLAGTLNGQFLTRTKLGALTGNVFGVYNITDNTWQALSGGTWSGALLSHVSDISSSLRATTRYYEGRFYYDNGGSYFYSYSDDNHSGQLHYYRPATEGSTGEHYEIDYNADGTYSKYDDNSGTTTTGNWQEEGHDSLAFLATQRPDGYVRTDSYDYAASYEDGSLEGLMGGTALLWTATAASPAPVTMLGQYSPGGALSHLWTTQVSSYNYNAGSPTTYDGGAYRGFLGGTEVGGVMEGRLIALYVDINGNAGYLQGSLAGTADRGTEMFKLEGGLYTTQVATGIGIAPENLTDSIWPIGGDEEYYDNANFLAGKFTGEGGGEIQTGNNFFGEGYYKGNWYQGMSTMSIVNYEQNRSELWGIYSISLGGTYTNPTAAWTAKVGGMNVFGAIGVANRHEGAYNYADGGSYSYNYYTDNRSGHVSYSRPAPATGGAGENYYINYHADGTYDGFDYLANSGAGAEISGTWDTTKPLATLIATPVDSNTTSFSESHHGVGNDDSGLWLGDVKDGAWSVNRLTGRLSGRFMTYSKMGTLGGEAVGVYNAADNTWQAMSSGNWSGTPLSFTSFLYSCRYDAYRNISGRYDYSGGGSYEYEYYSNGGYGYTREQPTANAYPYSYTYYRSDGRTKTYSYDANGTETLVNGVWDLQTETLSMLATPPTRDGETAMPAGSPEEYIGHDHLGDMAALVGGTESLWYDSSHTINAVKTGIPVTMLGMFMEDNGSGYAQGRNSLWYTDEFFSMHQAAETYTTSDGGAYGGFLGGIDMPGATPGERIMEGRLISLYIDPEGNAGYLNGNLTGHAYTDLSLFEMDGLIDRIQLKTAAEMAADPAARLSAAVLYDNVESGVLEARLAGGFKDGAASTGLLTGEDDVGSTLAIVDGTRFIAQDWGVYGLTLYGEYDTAKPVWQAVLGGTGDFGKYIYQPGEASLADDWGYWLTNVNGAWGGDGKITGPVTGTFLTYTKLGVIDGNLLGAYNDADQTWEAISLGAWLGQALSHVSEVSGSLRATTRYFEGSYSYDDGGSYSYSYYADNRSASLSYSRPASDGVSGANYTINYNADGTYSKYDDISGGTTIGNWQEEGHDSLAFVATQQPTGYASAESYDYFYPYTDGSLQGLMGGTASLWTATAASPALVTMLGSYAPAGNVPHLLTTEVYSHNYKNYSDTTYDGGAYRGFLGATEVGGAMAGAFAGLYVDASGNGNVGYLRGAFTGAVYREIKMFNMQGGLYPTQMATGTGITPENFYDSLWLNNDYDGEGYYGRTILTGAFAGTDGGTITAGNNYCEGDCGNWGWGGMSTLSFVDYEGNRSANWGIYGLSTGGIFTNPGTAWTAQVGGHNAFGANHVANYHYGNYNYADGGSYSYNYYTDSRSGHVNYYRPAPEAGGVAENYYIDYYADGTYSKYDYSAPSSPSTIGNWRTDEQASLSFLANPLDATANPMLAYASRYGVGDSDEGYWLADISDGAWSGNRLAGKLNGRFLTYTKMGTLAGDVFGVYNTGDNTWQALSGGVWSGVPLQFMNEFYSSLTGFDEEWAGSMSGIMGGAASLWFEPGTATINAVKSNVPVAVMGSYYEYQTAGNMGKVWYDGYIPSENYNDGTHTTYDGGAYFLGAMGGVALPATAGKKTLEGMVVGLYVDPNGNAGYLRGTLAGQTYPEQELFVMDGSINREQKATAVPMNLQESFWNGSNYVEVTLPSSPARLYESVWEEYIRVVGMQGSFKQGDVNYGSITANESYGDTYWITDWETTSQDWGIFGLELSGAATPDLKPAWEVKIGGTGIFGSRTEANYYGSYLADDDGAWLANLDGTWSEDGKITGALTGEFVTYAKLGTINGDLLGLYSDTDGIWQGISAGIYEGRPTEFGGDWYRNAIYNNGGWLDWNGGNDQGFFGLARRSDGNYDFLAIGEYSDYGIWDANENLVFGRPHLWSDSLAHYGDTATSNLEAYTAGIWQKTDPDDAVGKLSGFIAGIYYREDGKVGLVKGTLAGASYEMGADSYGDALYGMWKVAGGASGLINIDKAYDLTSGFNGSNGYISEDSLAAYAAGSFGENGGTGIIRGEWDEGSTKFIAFDLNDGSGNYLETKSLPFGIYNLTMGWGGDVSYYEGKLADASVPWKVKIGDDGWFGYNYGDEGFWLADVTGKWDEYGPEAGHGTITGVLEGSYVTSTHMGAIGGHFFGLYTEDGIDSETGGYGTWIGASAGTYEGKPTNFGGEWNHSLLYNNAGVLDWNSDGDDNWGYFGFALRPDGKYDFQAIGEYYDYGILDAYGNPVFGAPHIWSGSLWDNDETTNRYMEALTGGIWEKGTMVGSTAALYYREDGAVGLIKGGLTGHSYEMSYDSYWNEIWGMWQAVSGPAGLVNIDKTATLPADFDVATADINSNGGLKAYTAGSFVIKDENNQDSPTGAMQGGNYYSTGGSSTKFITMDVDGSRRSLPFGIYTLKLGGEQYHPNQYTGRPSGAVVNYKSNIGGEGNFGYHDDKNDHGYWLAEVTGKWTEDAAGAGKGTIAGALGGNYITPTHMGAIGGSLYGLYNDEEVAGSGSWIGMSVGTYEGQPLAFFSEVAALDGNLQGFMGGTASLWTATAASPASVTMVGRYNPADNNPRLWTTDVISNNYIDALVPYTTYDGGAYWSLLSGTESGGEMVAALIGLYADGNGNAGYLKGGLIGTADRDLDAFKLAGGLSAIPLPASTVEIAPQELADGISGQDLLNLTATDLPTSLAALTEARRSEACFAQDPTWGVWQAVLEGTGAGATGAWMPPASLSWVTAVPEVGGPVVDTYWTNAAWTAENAKVTGTAAGAKADWVNAATYVYGGEIKGLFDPTAATWKAVAQGAFMETAKFLAMQGGATTDADANAALKALNIPAVQVGQASLSGSNSDMTVNMNNVGFFATSVGTSPKIWATKDVAGTYTQPNPALNVPINLSGGGLNADFTMRQWDGAKWGATVTNGAGVVAGQNIQFQGGAAGNITTSTTSFSGTAAGTVK